MKDTIKEKLTNIVNDIDNGAKIETVKSKILNVIEDYDGFRKAAEYMSGMVESLQKRVDDYEQRIGEGKDAAA